MDLGMFFLSPSLALFTSIGSCYTQQTSLLIEIRAVKIGVLKECFLLLQVKTHSQYLEALSKLSSFINQISDLHTPAFPTLFLSLSIDRFLHNFSSTERKKAGQKKSCCSFFPSSFSQKKKTTLCASLHVSIFVFHRLIRTLVQKQEITQGCYKSFVTPSFHLSHSFNPLKILVIIGSIKRKHRRMQSRRMRHPKKQPCTNQFIIVLKIDPVNKQLMGFFLTFVFDC